MLVHDHSWIGVLIAGRNRSRSGVPAEVFTNADIRSLVAISEAATPLLHAVDALWNLPDNGQGPPTALSPVAGAGPTAGRGSAPAPGESAAAEEGGMPTPEGRPPSVPTFPPGLEDRSTDRVSIPVQTSSAQRPVSFDPSEIDRPLPPAPLQDHDLPQSVAVEIAERLAADVVVVLLDNGEGLMEVAGGVGLTPADVHLSVDYSHEIIRELFWTSLRLIEDTNQVGRALVGIPGSHAQTLLMAMLVHDHSWIGVLIAGRNRSRSGVPAEVFTNADIRSLVAISEAATPLLHAVDALWNLPDNGQGPPTALSPVAGAGPTAGRGSAPAPGESAAAEEGGMPTPEGRPPSVPTFPPGLEDRSTDRVSIPVQTSSAQRPVSFDPSEIDRPLPPAPLQDHDLPQSVAVEIAERLAADVVVVLLDNGEGLMEVAGGVGLSAAEQRITVGYDHEIIRELFRSGLGLVEDTGRVRGALSGVPGSQAQTLLMAALVHHRHRVGVLIAGRRGSAVGQAADAFDDADLEALVAVVGAAIPSLHRVVLLRRS
jgi:hypothetical protein